MSSPLKSPLPIPLEDLEIFHSITNSPIELAKYYIRRNNGDVQKATLEFLARPKHNVHISGDTIRQILSFITVQEAYSNASLINSTWNETMNEDETWDMFCKRDFKGSEKILATWKEQYTSLHKMKSTNTYITVDLPPIRWISHNHVLTAIFDDKHDTYVKMKSQFGDFILYSPYSTRNFEQKSQHQSWMLSPIDKKHKGSVFVYS